MDLKKDRVFADGILSDMKELLYQTLNEESVSEITKGFGRLKDAGACTENEMNSIMEEYHITADAYKDYLFSIGYYKELSGGGYYIDESCDIKPEPLFEFHDGLSSFSDSVCNIDGPNTPSL